MNADAAKAAKELRRLRMVRDGEARCTNCAKLTAQSGTLCGDLFRYAAIGACYNWEKYTGLGDER